MQELFFCVKHVAQQKQKFAHLSQKLQKSFENGNPI